jgi:hypothetical protein
MDEACFTRGGGVTVRFWAKEHPHIIGAMWQSHKFSINPIPGHYKKKVVGLEWGPLSLASTTEELLDRKVAASV